MIILLKPWIYGLILNRSEYNKKMEFNNIALLHFLYKFDFL